MKKIYRDIPGDDPGRVEEPTIENRRELHQFLESVMTRSHELKRECQSLEDMNRVKSYFHAILYPFSESVTFFRRGA